MEIKWGPIGREVYERTYQRREDTDWAATVARVVKGNAALVPEEFIEPGELEALTRLIESFDMLPAGRHLWASGADTALGLFNCHRAGWSTVLSDHFTFVFDQLMLGGGVGANYSADPYMNATPAIDTNVELELTCMLGHPDFEEVEPLLSRGCIAGPVHTVPDTREGWVEALGLVIDAHCGGLDKITISLSAVRGRGELIKGFGGTASGPGPLALMLVNVNTILNSTLGRKLSPIEAMDIDHAIASCVVAGNVRRSARMSILHWDDPSILEFITCKADPSKHWSTNISVEVDTAFFAALDMQDAHATTVMTAVVNGIYANGEPGFYNSSLASNGETGDVRATNPCGEIALEEWEQCLLGHVNLSAFADDHYGALEAFRLMTRYLVRATHGVSSDSRQEAVKNRNRRIGVGFFGFHDWAAMNGVAFSDIHKSVRLRSRLEDYKIAVDVEADDYSEQLGISRPVKTTTVAPTGSVAKLPGVSEGLQPPFARYFVRRIRYSATDPKLSELTHLHQEPCLYAANTTVVSFVSRDPIVDKVDDSLVMQSDEVSLSAYLLVQRLVQTFWADNAVSVTANFDRADVSVVEMYDLLRQFLPDIKGWTGMPEDGRPQSPYERLTAEQFALAESTDVSQAMDDCATGACPVR
jgi:ribonucleoside-triphosphate reductase